MPPDDKAHLADIVSALAREWQVGGMGPDSMYGEFAIEVAKRALAAASVAPSAELRIDPRRPQSIPSEAPHVHTTCSKCGARSWFLEFQWNLLSKGCAPSAAAPRRCREGADRDCSPACDEKSRTYCSWKGF